MIVFLRLAMDADLAHEGGEVVVVGEHRAAVSVAAQGFEGKKEVQPTVLRPQDSALSRAKALGGIFDDRQSVVCPRWR